MHRNHIDKALETPGFGPKWFEDVRFAMDGAGDAVVAWKQDMRTKR